MRLRAKFRRTLYCAFSALLLSGCAWLAADQLKDSDAGDLWQDAGTYLLMLHGGAAMLALMLLGALVPLHVSPSWRSRRNRIVGGAMAALNAALILTAFGLYYAGADWLRTFASDAHIGLGLALPFLWLIHVMAGWRGSARR